MSGIVSCYPCGQPAMNLFNSELLCDVESQVNLQVCEIDYLPGPVPGR